MAEYNSFAELVDAIRGGLEVIAFIDNDDVSFLTTYQGEVTDDYDDVYSTYPEDLLEQCLDLLGIPHEHV